MYSYTLTSNNHKEKLKKTIPFTIAPPKKAHRNKFNQRDKKDLYTENYKILMKKIKTKQVYGKIFHSLDWKNVVKNVHITQKKSIVSMQSISKFQ